MEHTNEPTTRELQLELQIWMERKNALVAKSQTLQAQSVLLKMEADNTEANIKRLQAALAPKPAAVDEAAPAQAAA